jgi:chromosomal replication initiation ATPase DnaA
MSKIDTIVNECCEVFHVCKADLTSRYRSKNMTNARRAVVWILHEVAGLSYPEIAAVLGRRHHSSAFDLLRSWDKIDADKREHLLTFATTVLDGRTRSGLGKHQ